MSRNMIAWMWSDLSLILEIAIEVNLCAGILETMRHTLGILDY